VTDVTWGDVTLVDCFGKEQTLRGVQVMVVEELPDDTMLIGRLVWDQLLQRVKAPTAAPTRQPKRSRGPVSTTVPTSVSIRVATVNAGTGGWKSGAVRLIYYMVEKQVHILQVSESHLSPGDSVDRIVYDGDTFLISRSVNPFRTGPVRYGGELLVTNITALERLTTVSMVVLDGAQHTEDVCEKADTHTVQFTFAGTTKLAVISTYIPPDKMVYASVCPKDVECVGTCPSNHPGVNIDHVERQLVLRRAEGAVIVLGDCNADTGTKRFAALEQQWSIGPGQSQLQIANAHGKRGGVMKATRGFAVLDYILTKRLQIKSCQVDLKAHISDHHPVLADVVLDMTPPPQVQQLQQPTSDGSYGMVGTQQWRDLPIGIRGNANKELPRHTEAEWDVIRTIMAEKM
jgi:hypothetical protein